jgi:hypothetical protein
MADPATGNTTTPTSGTPFQYTGTNLPGQGGASVDVGAPSTGDNNWLTTIGSDLSGAATSANNWLQSPTGQLVQGAIPIAGTLYEAGRAQSQGNALTNAITAAARPQLNLGTGTVGQLTGGPSVGGPMGTYISGATGAANELATTAQTYGTGNLTPAQQQQVNSFAAGQKAQVAGSLAKGSGTLDSSTRAAMNQEVDNNTAMLSQALVNQNIQIASGALSAVNQTYNQLLGMALSQSGLGTEATSNAVQLQLKNNQQLQTLLQQIFSGMATQMATAQGGQVSQQGGQKATTPGAQAGASAMQILQKYLGGGGGGGGTPAQGTPVSSGYQWGTGPGGSDYAPGVSAPDVAPTTQTPSDYGSIPMGSTGSPDWLSSMNTGGDGVSLDTSQG